MTDAQILAIVLLFAGGLYTGVMFYAQIRMTSAFNRLWDQLDGQKPQSPRTQRYSDSVIKHASLLAKDVIAQVIEQRKTAPGKREFTVEFEPRTSREIVAAARGILKSCAWYPIFHSDGKALIAPSRREDVEKLCTSSADLAYLFDSDGPFELTRYADGSEPYVASPWEIGM